METEELFIDGHKLPQPLPKKDLYELVEKMKRGNNGARETIIEHNIRLVLYEVTNKFKTVDYDKKELVAIGNIGLMKAVDSFDPTKNIEFATYASHCIDNEILMFLRKLKKDKILDSLDRVVNVDNSGNELILSDILSSDIDIIEEYTENDIHSHLRNIVQGLPERDREIIMLHFGFYNDIIYTQKEIAEKFHISQSYVSRLITKIVKRLGFKLNEEGLIELANKVSTSPKKGDEEIMNKNLKTIYEYFDKYSKDEINTMLSKLSEEERNLVSLRYGDDLENPQTSDKWNKDCNNKYYGNVVPKMKRLLENPTDEKIKRGRKPRIQKDNFNAEMDAKETVQENSSVVTNKDTNKLMSEVETKVTNTDTNSTTIENDEVSKEDYLNILEVLKTPTFTEMVSSYSPKTAMIASLKLGYVDGKYFSTQAIANFLDIEEQEVTDIIKTVLYDYKARINDVIDDAIRMVDKENSANVKNKSMLFSTNKNNK